jgi:branched-chain amino acid transport system substrate-binding protein
MIRVFSLAVAIASAALCAQADNPPVVVGAVVSQSGHLADLAADLRKGLLLWQEEVNAAGGLLGRRVELQLLDDGSEARAAGELYGRLMREHGAQLLVGPFGSAATLGAAAAAERARRVLVNATGAASAMQKAAHAYVFQVPAPFAEYGAGPLEIARRMNYRRLAILARNDPAAREMAGRLREDAVKAGLAPGEVDIYASGQDDFSPQIARARKADAQAWIAFGQPRDAAEMVKSFRKAGFAPALFVAQGAAEPEFVRLVGQDAEGAMGIAPYERRAATRGNAQFAEAYARKWSAEPGLTAAQGYSAGRILEEAVKRAGSLEQEKLRDALAQLQTETPLGRYRVDRAGAQVAAKPSVVQIQRGRRELVWPEALATASWQLPYPRWEERTLLK